MAKFWVRYNGQNAACSLSEMQFLTVAAKIKDSANMYTFQLFINKIMLKKILFIVTRIQIGRFCTVVIRISRGLKFKIFAV